jgi:hypothetical protein
MFAYRRHLNSILKRIVGLELKKTDFGAEYANYKPDHAKLQDFTFSE